MSDVYNNNNNNHYIQAPFAYIACSVFMLPMRTFNSHNYCNVCMSHLCDIHIIISLKRSRLFFFMVKSKKTKNIVLY